MGEDDRETIKLNASALGQIGQLDKLIELDFQQFSEALKDEE